MRARIVKIGNSRGIRIPKPLLDQTGITEDVELEVVDDCIIIKPVSKPREGWDAAFSKIADQGDDILLNGMDAISHSWDEEEWKW